MEVCLNGDWGTVCHYHWSTVDANVACRQLGYSGSGMREATSAHNVNDVYLSYLFAQTQQLISVHTLAKIMMSSSLWMILLALYMNPD